MRRWARRLLRGARASRCALHGTPAAEAALLVANHVSWLDTYAIHTVDAARFVAKSEVAAWPVIGAIAARFGTIFIKRGCFRSAARTVGALAEALCRGRIGGRLSRGDDQRRPRRCCRFYPAMFQAAVLHRGARAAGGPALSRPPTARRSRRAPFVGDMSVADSLRLLLREPRLTVEVIFCAPIDPYGLSRRELARAARAAIAAALGLARRRSPIRRPPRRVSADSGRCPASVRRVSRRSRRPIAATVGSAARSYASVSRAFIA